MGQITRDGVTFDSDWIDVSVARYKDKSIPWAVRTYQLPREIAMRENDLQSMLETMPNDREGHAHCRAHLDALKLIGPELNAEIFRL
jgi:hypothetical protein